MTSKLKQQRAVKNYFKEKQLSHKCFTLAFVRLFVAAAATILSIKNLTSGELKARHLSLTKMFFMFESTATHNHKKSNSWNLWVDLFACPLKLFILHAFYLNKYGIPSPTECMSLILKIEMCSFKIYDIWPQHVHISGFLQWQ